MAEVGGQKEIEKTVESALKENDSIGGIIECRSKGLPVGLGEPFFDSVESLISHLVFAIPGIKGIEFGSGFACSRMRGSECNDIILNRKGKTKTNHAGGILGGISTGQEIRARIAVKPTSSIEKEQYTIDIFGHERRISIQGRHDPCICPRIVPVAEAMMALVLYDALLRQRDLEEKVEGLDQLRLEIDALDHRLIQLLAERKRISIHIGQYKEEREITVADRKREKDLLDQRAKWATEVGMKHLSLAMG